MGSDAASGARRRAPAPTVRLRLGGGRRAAPGPAVLELQSLTVLPLLTGRPVTWSVADAEGTFPSLVASLLFGALTVVEA